MLNKYFLLNSKIINETGDWFYYFVIVIIMFSVSHNPIYLGLLSASYTLPGLILSKPIADFSEKFESRKIIIFTEFFRFVFLILMFFAKSAIMLLLLVFLEQILAIGSNLNFQNIVVHIISKKNELKKFNKDLNTLSTISRLAVIPAYVILTKAISNRGFLIVDAVFTLIAGLLVIPIRDTIVFKKDSSDDAGFKKVYKIMDKTTCLIFILSMVSLLVAFSDSYAISYINDNGSFLKVGYSVFVFIMTLAELLASLTSKKFDDIAEKDKKGSILTFVTFTSGFLVMCSAVFHNNVLFIISMALGRVVYMWIQLFTLYWYQNNGKRHIMSYVALQNMAVGGIAIFNSSGGSLIIKSANIYVYIGMISLVVFLSVATFKHFYGRSNL